MKILEFMSFSPDWFLTTPGLIVTVGVVLLLIATIIFLSSNKKNESIDELKPQETSQSEIAANVPIQPEVNFDVPVQNMTSNVEIPSIPIENNEVTEIVPPTFNSTVSVGSKVEPALQQESPIIEIPSAPVVEEKPTVSIYGGVSPSDMYKVAPPEEVKPVIYGGANPLENTAPIPRVDLKPEMGIFNTQKEEVKFVDDPVNVTPQLENVAVVNNGDTTTIPAEPVVEPINTVPIENTEITADANTPTATETVQPKNNEQDIETLEF